MASDTSLPNGQSPPPPKVVIAGAGPAGLLLGLLLGQQGIPVLILEAWDRLDERLRATQYGTPASRIFRKAGILDDIRKLEITNFGSICWRTVKPDQDRLTGINLGLVKDDPDRMTVMPLNMILKIMYEHVKRLAPVVEVRFEHTVVAVGQDAEKAWVEVERANGEKSRFEADYVVGCDGATSKVRHELFGREWPGVTWPFALHVQNVFYPGFEEHGWGGGNYMIDPEHWGLIAERGKGGLWRVTYGDIPDLSEAEYLKRREWHFETMLPGHPKPSQYRVEQTNAFRSHNRCVEKMRVGRILLAADAAHVCNPFGGYGCMSGVLDAGALADCLTGIYQGRASDDILDKYAEIRRQKFLDIVDKRSVKNMRRLNALDPSTALQEDKFLQILVGLEKDSDEAKAFLLKHSSLEHDFTQYYTS